MYLRNMVKVFREGVQGAREIPKLNLALRLSVAAMLVMGLAVVFRLLDMGTEWALAMITGWLLLLIYGLVMWSYARDKKRERGE